MIVNNNIYRFTRRGGKWAYGRKADMIMSCDVSIDSVSTTGKVWVKILTSGTGYKVGELVLAHENELESNKTNKEGTK